MLDKQPKLNEYIFTFQTDKELYQARLKGHIDWYDMVRVKLIHINGTDDFPVHTKEELSQFIEQRANNYKIEIYQSKHCYDITDYE